MSTRLSDIAVDIDAQLAALDSDADRIVYLSDGLFQTYAAVPPWHIVAVTGTWQAAFDNVSGTEVVPGLYESHLRMLQHVGEQRLGDLLLRNGVGSFSDNERALHHALPASEPDQVDAPELIVMPLAPVSRSSIERLVALRWMAGQLDTRLTPPLAALALEARLDSHASAIDEVLDSLASSTDARAELDRLSQPVSETTRRWLDTELPRTFGVRERSRAALTKDDAAALSFAELEDTLGVESLVLLTERLLSMLEPTQSIDSVVERLVGSDDNDTIEAFIAQYLPIVTAELAIMCPDRNVAFDIIMDQLRAEAVVLGMMPNGSGPDPASLEVLGRLVAADQRLWQQFVFLVPPDARADLRAMASWAHPAEFKFDGELSFLELHRETRYGVRRTRSRRLDANSGARCIGVIVCAHLTDIDREDLSLPFQFHEPELIIERVREARRSDGDRFSEWLRTNPRMHDPGTDLSGPDR